MALAVELQLDPVVDDAFALHPVADACLDQQVGRPLLEHAGTDPVLDVVAASVLENDGLDPGPLEQPAEGQPGRAGADDPDLRPHQPAARSNSAACPCPTPTQSVASP